MSKRGPIDLFVVPTLSFGLLHGFVTIRIAPMNDTKAVFTAASKASEAADYLVKLGDPTCTKAEASEGTKSDAV